MKDERSLFDILVEVIKEVNFTNIKNKIKVDI